MSTSCPITKKGAANQKNLRNTAPLDFSDVINFVTQFNSGKNKQRDSAQICEIIKNEYLKLDQLREG